MSVVLTRGKIQRKTNLSTFITRNNFKLSNYLFKWIILLLNREVLTQQVKLDLKLIKFKSNLNSIKEIQSKYKEKLRKKNYSCKIN